MGIYKLAVKIILVHNHPSGSLTISRADEDVTDKLLKVGKIIEIDVVDHLIITEDNFTSFGEKGVMEKLQNSGLYELVEREQEDIKAFKLEMEKEKSKNEERLEIATRMKNEGFDVDAIKKLTKLTKREIDKI